MAEQGRVTWNTPFTLRLSLHRNISSNCILALIPSAFEIYPTSSWWLLIEHHKRSVWTGGLQPRAPCSAAFACLHPVPQADTDTLCPILFFWINHHCCFCSSHSWKALSHLIPQRKVQAEGSQGAGQPKLCIPAAAAQNGNWFLVPLHTLLHVWPRRKTQPHDCTVTQETHPGYLSLERNTRAEKGV